MEGVRRIGWHLAEQLWRTAMFVLLCVLGAVLLIPFLWMVSTSLKPITQVYKFPPIWIPNPPRWINYREALLDLLPFPLFFRNSLFVTILSVVGAVLTSSMVAFAFARLRWPGRDYAFLLVLATMMLPFYSTVVPVFVVFQRLHWIDTYKPLIIPSWGGGGAFFIFLMRQFFMTIPLDLDDAGRIDGCSSFRVWWSVIMPLAKPAIATVGIYNFMGQWNDFFRPLIFVNSLQKYTLALGLNAFRSSQSTGLLTNYAWLMAASVVALAPCLLLFFLAQKAFIQGVVMSGLRG